MGVLAQHTKQPNALCQTPTHRMWTYQQVGHTFICSFTIVHIDLCASLFVKVAQQECRIRGTAWMVDPQPGMLHSKSTSANFASCHGITMQAFLNLGLQTCLLTYFPANFVKPGLFGPGLSSQATPVSIFFILHTFQNFAERCDLATGDWHL